MREWLQDLRYGARMVVKRPGTSAIAIVALALGHRPHDDDVLDRRRASSCAACLSTESDRIVFVPRATVKQPDRRDNADAARSGGLARPAEVFDALAGYYDQARDDVRATPAFQSGCARCG